MTQPTRTFPPPWTAERMPSGYLVRDANGQVLGYFYGEDVAAWRTSQLGLTADEARRLTVGFTRLPDLMKHLSLSRMPDP